MKKTIFLIIGLVVSFACRSQQIVVGERSNIILPDGSEKITKQQALSHVDQRFKHDKVLSDIISHDQSEHMYRIDNMLLTFYAPTRDVKEN